MQAQQDNTRDHSNYFFILKCMGALAAASALIAGVYWLTKTAPLADITAKTLFTFAATTTSLPAVLALVGIIALFCVIPFAVGGRNNYYPQAHVHNGYTSGFSFWQPAPVHNHVYTAGGHSHDHSHVHGSGGSGAHNHGHSVGGGHSAGMGHSHGHH